MTNSDKKQKNSTESVVAVLIGFAILFFAMQSCDSGSSGTSSNKSTSTSRNKDYKQEAYVCAKMEVEDLLRSPSSADFPFVSYKDVTTSLGSNKYSVKSYVEADNAFGAKIKNNYKCTVKVLNDGDSCNASCELY